MQPKDEDRRIITIQGPASGRKTWPPVAISISLPLICGAHVKHPRLEILRLSPAYLILLTLIAVCSYAEFEALQSGEVSHVLVMTIALIWTVTTAVMMTIFAMFSLYPIFAEEPLMLLLDEEGFIEKRTSEQKIFWSKVQACELAWARTGACYGIHLKIKAEEINYRAFRLDIRIKRLFRGSGTHTVTVPLTHLDGGAATAPVLAKVFELLVAENKASRSD
ncbi:hypothetical protein ACU5AY_03470 [Rhizobium sp. PAMB 3174]